MGVGWVWQQRVGVTVRLGCGCNSKMCSSRSGSGTKGGCGMRVGVATRDWWAVARV